MIRSVLRGWPWILGATLVAAVVVAISWVSTPQLFRTTVELRIMPPGDPQLWEDPKALERAIAAEGQRMIAMVMGGEVKEAVALSESIAEQFGLDLTTGKWRKTWSMVWNQRVMVAGPVDGEIFLIIDDEDGDRGVALAGAVLEALEDEWRRQVEDFKNESIDRLDRLIGEDLGHLVGLAEQYSILDENDETPESLALVAERDLAAQQVAESRMRRNRLESLSPDQPLPWIVVKKPFSSEHRMQRNPRIPIVLSALALVLLVAVGWVAYDSRSL